MVVVAGPPPGEFVERYETTGQCFGYEYNGHKRLRLKFGPEVRSWRLIWYGIATWIASNPTAVPPVTGPVCLDM